MPIANNNLHVFQSVSIRAWSLFGFQYPQTNNFLCNVDHVQDFWVMAYCNIEGTLSDKSDIGRTYGMD